VEVSVDGNVVRVFADGAEVALHVLQAPGGASIDDRHYPTPPPTGVRALRPVTATEREFLALGPVAEAYLRTAAAAGASACHAPSRTSSTWSAATVSTPWWSPSNGR